MNSILKKHEDGTIELTITIPADSIEKVKNNVIDEHVKEAVLPGFRKGMAPKDIVEKTINQEHLKEDILRNLLPESYVEALKEHNITPILNPKIHVDKLEDGKDWVFTAFTAQTPQVTLGNYKKAVKNITAKSKIIVPGKVLPTGRQDQQPVSFEEIAKELMAVSAVIIPKIIIDQEVERLLSQTLDEVKRLGLTLDQYLASTGRNSESLRKEYELKAQNDVKLEFVLQKIAETENINVEDKEIDEAIMQAQNETERQNLQANKHLLTGIIRQQKTLDLLRNL